MGKKTTISDVLRRDNISGILAELNKLHQGKRIAGILTIVWRDDCDEVNFQAAGITSKDLVYQMETVKAKIIAEDQRED